MSANIEVKFHFILQVTDELCSEDSVSILFSRTVFLTSGEVTEALRVAVMWWFTFVVAHMQTLTHVYRYNECAAERVL